MLMRMCVLVCVWAFGPGAAAGVVYVKADAGGANDGSSWADAFTNLEDGLAAAGPGDQVWLAEGVYTPSVRRTGVGEPSGTPGNEVFLLGSGVSLYGGFLGHEATLGERAGSAHATVLTGDLGGGLRSRTVVLHLQGPPGATHRARLDSVRITGADGTGTPRSGGGVRALGWSNSQGIFPARLDIVGCVIDSNRSGQIGAGAYLSVWQGTIEATVFESNTAGMWAGGVEIINAFAPSVVRDSVFRGNATSPASGMNGGGMRIASPTDSGAIAVEGCVFDQNQAGGSGGGLSVFFSGSMSGTDPRFAVRNSVFTRNHAGAPGGGIVLNQFNFDPSLSFQANLQSCTVADNTTGSDRGPGVFVGGGALLVRNSILWGNTLADGPAGQVGVGPRGSLSVAYSCVEGGADGPGNIAADPGFVGGGEYRLTLGSACVDAGDTGLIPQTARDADGLPRLVNTPRPATGVGCPAIDMGAYELQEACVGDWNGDCALTFFDLIGYLRDHAGAEPGADLNGDGAVDFHDVAAFVAVLLAGC